MYQRGILCLCVRPCGGRRGMLVVLDGLVFVFFLSGADIGLVQWRFSDYMCMLGLGAR